MSFFRVGAAFGERVTQVELGKEHLHQFLTVTNRRFRPVLLIIGNEDDSEFYLVLYNKVFHVQKNLVVEVGHGFSKQTASLQAEHVDAFAVEAERLQGRL